MNVLGVDLTGSDAVICFLIGEDQEYTLADFRVRKLTLSKKHDRKDIQKFQFDFSKLIADYKINLVAIRERMTKGKFAGGAISFKMEAALQLIPEANSILLSSSQIKDALAESPIPIAFAETGLKVFQEGAFKVAYAAHILK